MTGFNPRPGCTLCYDAGWILEAKDRAGAVTLEIIPCLIPDCEKSGQPIALMSVDGLRCNSVAKHPTEGYVMSIADRVKAAVCDCGAATLTDARLSRRPVPTHCENCGRSLQGRD